MKSHTVKESKDPASQTEKVPSSAFLPRYKNLERAAHVALHYGFRPLPALSIPHRTSVLAKQFMSGILEKDAEDLFNIEEKIALLEAYAGKKHGSASVPSMTFYESRIPRDGERRGLPHCRIVLDVLGSTKSIADAILVQTAYTILKEEGIEDLVVDINSLGDRESAIRFTREFTNYYKKYLSELPAPERALFKKEPLALLSSENERCKELNLHAPEPISFLSESSRQHFKEVLEFFEALEIPYRIAPSLIGDKNYCSETVFAIHSASASGREAPFAIGRRYNSLSKKTGLKKEIAAAGVVIYLPKEKMEVLKVSRAVSKKPKFYFIQIGFEARLKSIRVIEMLRQAKISLIYTLIKDKFVGQLSTAEEIHTPYLLIMGQKESMEDSVLVRTMRNLSQETVLISDLPHHLSKLK